MTQTSVLRRSLVPSSAAASALIALLLALGTPAAALAATTLPPTINLAATPLLSTRTVQANVLLSLSVEFPTVGAAYNRNTSNGTAQYQVPPNSASTSNLYYQYIGYFEPHTCYSYSVANARFEPAVATDAYYQCDGTKFSGNFMNWVTMSSIDAVRLALTGGRRSVDTTTTTVLTRAYLPSGETNNGLTQPSNFYASSTYFPRRNVNTTTTGATDAPVDARKFTPFGQASITVVNCRDQVMFGQYTGGNNSCASPGNDASLSVSGLAGAPYRFQVSVLVCSSTEGPTRPVLCTQYGTGSSAIYKPVGSMQLNSDKIRFGAMAYVLANADQSRQGAVLRAPMKWVGPNNYNNLFQLSGTNPNAEWSATTGIMTNDPDGMAGSGGGVINSGVMNYLNNFGSNPTSPGMYKGYDPVSELFYEGIRYYQYTAGPTAAAVTGLPSTALQDGYPAYTTWAHDPLVCPSQPNFIIDVADANTWCDHNVPGNQYSGCYDAPVAADTAHAFDVTQWTDAVGNWAMGAPGGQTLLPNNTYLANLPDGPLKELSSPTTNALNLSTPLSQQITGAGSASYYIAGTALYAKYADIRPDTTTDTNSTGAQNVTTISIDVNEPSIDIHSRELFLAGLAGTSSPSVASNNYMLASSPATMINLLQTAIAQAATAGGSAGGGALSSTTLVPGATGIYAPTYTTSTWSGDVQFFIFNLNAATNQVSLSSTPTWTASAQMPLPANRNLVLGTTAAGSHLGGGTAFVTLGNLDSATQTVLSTNPATGNADSLGQQRLNYLRGDTSQAGVVNGVTGPFRVRPTLGTAPSSYTNVIGDIVNSTPTYVGKPNGRIADPGYFTWSQTTAIANRVAMVYAGANDGILHGFDATTGVERFGYIPSAVVPGLARLTNPAYAHQPYVDGGLTAQDALVSAASSPAKWTTVLAGALGGGGQGVFALDVGQPTDGSAQQNTTLGTANVLWEFTQADDADLGYVFGKPLVAPFNVNGTTRWFVVVSSGVNNYAADGSASTTGNGALFLLALDKSAGSSWVQGSNYYKLSLNVTSDITKPAGLSQPSPVTDLYGRVTRLYAGDLQGNLWRFDTANVGVTGNGNWGVSFSGAPLFVATAPDGTRQPITTQPSVAFGPTGGYMVLFGTGKLLAVTDLQSPFQQQTFYAVYDNGAAVTGGRSSLAARSYTISTGTLTGSAVVYSSTVLGWYLDLPDVADGERDISNALLYGTSVLFNSVIPGANPCGTGTSATYTLGTLTGLQLDANTPVRVASTVGYLASPSLVVIGSSGTGGEFGTGTNSTVVSIINTGSGVQGANGGANGNASASSPRTYGLVSGRLNWRELINWQQLRPYP